MMWEHWGWPYETKQHRRKLEDSGWSGDMLIVGATMWLDGDKLVIGDGYSLCAGERCWSPYVLQGVSPELEELAWKQAGNRVKYIRPTQLRHISSVLGSIKHG
jgi:hypothetical protein